MAALARKARKEKGLNFRCTLTLTLHAAKKRSRQGGSPFSSKAASYESHRRTHARTYEVDGVEDADGVSCWSMTTV